MKNIIYVSCSSFPIALIAAAMHTGQLSRTKKLNTFPDRHLAVLKTEGKKGRLIFMGSDEENNKIYALYGCKPKDFVLSFIESFGAMSGPKNYKIIDCSHRNSFLLSLGWFFYRSNVFVLIPLGRYLIYLKLKTMDRRTFCYAAHP